MAGLFSAFGAHRGLSLELTRREVQGRYRGASFGMLWSLISPFLMLCVYTLVFGVINKSQWPGSTGGRSEFALIIFVALIVHGMFAECFGRAPMLVLGNPNFVKRVVFPLEILPWPMLGSALFHALANVVVLMAMELVVGHGVPWTIVLFPLVLLPLTLMLAGLSWLLASLGVYFRDISQMVGVITNLFLFLSSAFVPVNQLPEDLRFWFHLNPLTFLIDQGRAVALFGELPDFANLALFTLGGLAFAWLGHAWFQRTRAGFADVL